MIREKLRSCVKKNLPWQSQFLMSSAPIRNNFIVSSPVNLMWLIRLSFRQKKTNFYVAFRHNKLKKPSAEIKNIIIIFLQHSGGHIWPEINTESMLMNLFWLEWSRHRTVCTIISRYPTRQNAGQFAWVIYIFWKLCVWWTPKSGTLPFWFLITSTFRMKIKWKTWSSINQCISDIVGAHYWVWDVPTASCIATYTTAYRK